MFTKYVVYEYTNSAIECSIRSIFIPWSFSPHSDSRIIPIEQVAIFCKMSNFSPLEFLINWSDAIRIFSSNLGINDSMLRDANIGVTNLR